MAVFCGTFSTRESAKPGNPSKLDVRRMARPDLSTPTGRETKGEEIREPNPRQLPACLDPLFLVVHRAQQLRHLSVVMQDARIGLQERQVVR